MPATHTPRPRWVLPAIVTGQLLVTSIWFAANAVIGVLQHAWGIAGGEGTVTTAVQLGFICGTLVYAVLGLSDRYHPGNVFLVSAVIGGGANAALLALPGEFSFVLAARFVAGFCLAGVYPVGMKIAASWYAGGLGRALGFLVGALVLGTASSHLLRGLGGAADWRLVIAATSLAALAGGLLVRMVPEGPYLARGGPVRFRGVLASFRHADFRASALGYFGHMWELYAFWAFVPVWAAAHGMRATTVPFMAAATIGIGALGCVGGGYLVRRFGGGRVALAQLSVSCACGLASPLLLHAPTAVFTIFLLAWGTTVVGDSPQFSALNARYAPPGVVGSALTLVNCIGFALTIPALSLLERLQFVLPPAWLLMALAPGPMIGLWCARRLLAREPHADTVPVAST